MINIEQLRNNPTEVTKALLRRGVNVDIELIQELDKKHRSLIQQTEQLRATRNRISKEIGTTKEKNEETIVQMKQINTTIKELEIDKNKLDKDINDFLLQLPNIPESDVPEGIDETANIECEKWELSKTKNKNSIPHWEIGKKLDIIDFARGVKLAGSRFFVMKNEGAKLERALINWMLDFHINENNYTELRLPFLVKSSVMLGSGNLPKFADNLYKDHEEDLWLIPTAEVPITSMHSDEILNETSLPINYTAHTACFRREKAAAGKDTRGIKRVHQFDKVELYKIVEPQNSKKELEKIVNDARAICSMLNLTHRVIKLCTGELGFASAKSFDIEVWAPGSKEWLEVSSCSQCNDFQARRANLKYRPTGEKQTSYVHTLNGSGLAIPRIIIAILETYQEEDGSITIPDVLVPYTGFTKINTSQ